MEYQKVDSSENQITLAASEKKLYQAPQLIERGIWTAKTGDTVVSEALGGLGNSLNEILP